MAGAIARRFEAPDISMTQALSLAEEERHLRATSASRQADADAIRANRLRGMSRKRQIEIYGQDLVDQVLAQ